MRSSRPGRAAPVGSSRDRRRRRSGHHDLLVHRRHLLDDHPAAGGAVVGVLGLRDGDEVSDEAQPLHAGDALLAVAGRTQRCHGRRRARGRGRCGLARAIERPCPMIGSLWPAASPISTTPSVNGSRSTCRRPDTWRTGRPACQPTPARSTEHTTARQAARNCAVPFGPENRCRPGQSGIRTRGRPPPWWNITNIRSPSPAMTSCSSGTSSRPSISSPAM